MMPSPKDICFAGKLLVSEGLVGNATPYSFFPQRPWAKSYGVNPTPWAPVTVGPFKKWFHIYGYLKRAVGAGPWQVRYPDVTVTYSDGSMRVYDCKFTNQRGRIDSSNHVGKTNGNYQLDDYQEINREQGRPTNGAPVLNRETCICPQKKRQRQKQTSKVRVRSKSPATAASKVPVDVPPPIVTPPVAPTPEPETEPGWKEKVGRGILIVGGVAVVAVGVVVAVKALAVVGTLSAVAAGLAGLVMMFGAAT